MLRSSAIAGVVLWLLFASTARASVVACPTSSPGTAFSGFGGASPSNGCAEIDKSFTNLSVTGMSSGAPTDGNVFLYATGTPPVGNTISPVGITFGTPGPGPIWQVSGGASQTETLGYEVTAHTGGTYTGGTYPTPATSGLIWVIKQIVLTPTVNVQNFFGGSANNATVTLAFCLNATSCSTGSASGTIVATYSGTSTAVYSCSYSGCVSGSSNTINLTGSVTQIAVAESISINTSSGSSLNKVTINSIQNQFGQGAVPEPSTFVLMGVGLLCIALRRGRSPT